MLFDLYNIPKEREFKYWFEKVWQVSTILGYDYFKLWDLNEYEFGLLDEKAIEELEKRQKKIREIEGGGKK